MVKAFTLHVHYCSSKRDNGALWDTKLTLSAAASSSRTLADCWACAGMAPCLFWTVFNLAVDHILKSTINKLQTRASSFLKHWLNTPKCATLASLFHPEVTNSPYIPWEGQTETSYLSSLIERPESQRDAGTNLSSPYSQLLSPIEPIHLRI